MIWLITVWFEVRVLPGPPRSPAQTEISQFNANRPELALLAQQATLARGFLDTAITSRKLREHSTEAQKE
jgi:hypothetical protein